MGNNESNQSNALFNVSSFRNDELGSTEDRPLPEEPLEPNVLAALRCPFSDNRELPFLVSCPSNCPFGHQRSSNNQRAPQVELRRIESYICLDRLLNRCEAKQLERITGRLVRCENGLHPENEDLIDVHKMASKLAQCVLSNKRSKSDVNLPRCNGCSKAISLDDTCGFLESCLHRLCFECVETLRGEPQIREEPSQVEFQNRFHNDNWQDIESRLSESQIPVQWQRQLVQPKDLLAEDPREWKSVICKKCRATSSRILLWPEPFCSRAYLEYLFASQKACFGLFVAPSTVAAIYENRNFSNRFELNYKNIIFKGSIGYTLSNQRGIAGGQGGATGTQRNTLPGKTNGF